MPNFTAAVFAVILAAATRDKYFPLSARVSKDKLVWEISSGKYFASCPRPSSTSPLFVFSISNPELYECLCEDNATVENYYYREEGWSLG